MMKFFVFIGRWQHTQSHANGRHLHGRQVQLQGFRPRFSRDRSRSHHIPQGFARFLTYIRMCTYIHNYSNLICLFQVHRASSLIERNWEFKETASELSVLLWLFRDRRPCLGISTAERSTPMSIM